MLLLVGASVMLLLLLLEGCRVKEEGIAVVGIKVGLMVEGA